MTTGRAQADETPGEPSRCWCCGRPVAADQAVRLGNHPEVAVCVRCARSIGKWGREIEDRGRSGPGVRARDGLRGVRKAVVRRGWHNAPIFGGPLRWLGKRLP